MPGSSSKRGGGWLKPYERHSHSLLPLPAFLRRVAFNLLLGCGFISISLLGGMWGYSHFEGMDATDSFLNASMILSGMGPAATLKTEAGKWFAGAYALYSGIAVLAVAGLVFAPLLHRLLHHFHAADDDLNPPDPNRNNQ